MNHRLDFPNLDIFKSMKISFNLADNTKVSEYNQTIPQSHTARHRVEESQNIYSNNAYMFVRQ